MTEPENTNQVAVLEVDGTVRLVPLDGSPTLQIMYRELGCDTVDVVSLPGAVEGLPDVDMWLDDNGLLTGKPVNELATTIAEHLREEFWQHYVGPVLFARTNDDGDTVGLTQGQIDALAKASDDYQLVNDGS